MAIKIGSTTVINNSKQWDLDFVPSGTAIDLGQSGAKWRDLYLSGAIIAATVDTGQGANELYDMNQNVKTTNAVTFATVNTGQGANELYDMNQNVKTDSAVTFATVNTGQGANELYDMNQNVKTDSAVSFSTVDTSGDVSVGGGLTITGSVTFGYTQVGSLKVTAHTNSGLTNESFVVSGGGTVTNIAYIGTSGSVTCGAANFGKIIRGKSYGSNPRIDLYKCVCTASCSNNSSWKWHLTGP